MKQFFFFLFVAAGALLLGACDSHSWDKETSRLYKHDGHEGSHGDSHTTPDAHAKPADSHGAAPKHEAQH
jgi:hypothetical protein